MWNPESLIPRHSGTAHLIPKLENLNSYYAMLCGNDRIVNVSQIEHLYGSCQPAVAPQMGRG